MYTTLHHLILLDEYTGPISIYVESVVHESVARYTNNTPL